jgi:hypothetical protein
VSPFYGIGFMGGIEFVGLATGPGVVIMRSLHLLTLSGVVLVGLTGLLASNVQAEVCRGPIDPLGVQLEQQQQNGVNFMFGGIGWDESCAIQRIGGYNLHMTFSTGRANEYVPDVKVAIQGPKGHEVLTLDEAGPIVLTRLPAGKYVVVTERNGHEVRHTIDLRDGGVRTLNIHWSDAS